jgi:hypothetical protein
MNFEIIGEISGIETIAVGSKIRDHQTPSEALWQRAVTKTERHCLDPLAQRTHPIGRTAFASFLMRMLRKMEIFASLMKAAKCSYL